MRTKWNFAADIKLCGAIIWIYYAVLIVFNVVIRSCKNFLFIYDISNYYFTNLYVFSDFIFPVFASFIIIFVFSNDLSEHCFEYLRSLPMDYGIVILKRYIRLLIVLIIPYVLTIINSGLILNYSLSKAGRIPLELYRYLYITVPIFLFYTAFGLFIEVILRKVFYSCSLCLGLIVEEYISGAIFTKKFRLFINSHQCEYTYSTFINNKIFYLIISVLLIVLSIIIIKIKLKRNKR